MDNSKRHAYLIIAHNDFDVLEKLLMLLDNDRNDIFIHIDKKVKNFDFDYYKNIVKKSGLCFTERTNIMWGHHSQIMCELLMLKYAVQGEYQYYHLLSGIDFPVKKQSEIHRFFDENNGKEFVRIADFDKNSIESRVVYYHFTRYHRNRNKYIRRIGRYIDRMLVNIQKRLKIFRKIANAANIKGGPNWFSITHSLAMYVVSEEKWIRKHFKHTLCADEVFLQTLITNSSFKENLYLNNRKYSDNMRYVSWGANAPRVLDNSDFDLLINSNKLFARKFSMKKEPEFVEKLYNYLKE